MRARAKLQHRIRGKPPVKYPDNRILSKNPMICSWMGAETCFMSKKGMFCSGVFGKPSGTFTRMRVSPDPPGKFGSACHAPGRISAGDPCFTLFYGIMKEISEDRPVLHRFLQESPGCRVRRRDCRRPWVPHGGGCPPEPNC